MKPDLTDCIADRIQPMFNRDHCPASPYGDTCPPSTATWEIVVHPAGDKEKRQPQNLHIWRRYIVGVDTDAAQPDA